MAAADALVYMVTSGVVEVLRVLHSRATHPVLFAMLYNGATSDAAARSCPSRAVVRADSK